MKRLLLVALGMALLLALASALPAAAYGGESSATMSCTNNTSTMTRTVIVTITWHAVQDGGVAEADVQAYEANSANLLAWGSKTISPPQAKGAASFTLSFNDMTPFGTVQWQLYNGAHMHLSRPARSMQPISRAARTRSVRVTPSVSSVRPASR